MYRDFNHTYTSGKDFLLSGVVILLARNDRYFRIDRCPGRDVLVVRYRVSLPDLPTG